jgi:hypothetical protein
MRERFHGKVDIKIGPIKVMIAGQFNAHQLADRRIAEPGKFIERQKVLLISHQQPKPVLSNIGHFNG